MSHRLVPISENEPLEPGEIVRLLRSEFKMVIADSEAGNEHVLGMIRQFERMNAPAEIIEAHRAMLGRAIRIVIADRMDCDLDYVVFTAMAKDYPLVGYSSGKHEHAAAPLLERACKVLKYKALLV